MYSLDQVIYFMEQRQQTEDWNIRDAAIAYLRGYREILPEYAQMKLDAVNDPLTWDELKGMEGKPVWVEGQYPHSWCIVREVQKYMDGTEEIVLDGLNCKIGIGRKEEYGTGWQAYRKERK